MSKVNIIRSNKNITIINNAIFKKKLPLSTIGLFAYIEYKVSKNEEINKEEIIKEFGKISVNGAINELIKFGFIDE
jgi:hypothetical protein